MSNQPLSAYVTSHNSEDIIVIYLKQSLQMSQHGPGVHINASAYLCILMYNIDVYVCGGCPNASSTHQCQ